MIRSSATTGLILFMFGCTGSIQDGAGSGPGRSNPSDPSDPSKPVDPSKPNPPAGSCKEIAPGPTRVWRLTHTQLKNTIFDAFGIRVPVLDTLPGEARLDGFANASERLGLSPVLLAYYDRGADAVADEVVKRSGEFVKCPMAMLGEGACLGDFLRTFGQKAWRRPLSDVELGKLDKLYRGAAAALTPTDGLKTVVKGLLLSASFLFRTELGTDARPGAVTKLTDVELASSLSYTLWDSPPDAALMELAVANKLHEPATLKAQAQRMFATSPKAQSALQSFMQQWLETESLTMGSKDATLFPAFNLQVAKDLEEETRLFVKGVVFDSGGDRSLRTLLTASYGYLNASTAKLYGQTATGAALTKTDLDPGQRRGLLTQASFLAAHADSADTSVVGRGRYLREQVLCAAVPPPPGDFKFNEKVITDDMTAREKFMVHAANPACASCHALFDVIGFALENYDAVGQYRLKDKNKTIDASGVLPLPSGGDLHFTNFIDMVDQLSKGSDAYDCFASQYLLYLSGKVKLDECERAEIARTFKTTGYRLDELALEIITSPRFVTRPELNEEAAKMKLFTNSLPRRSILRGLGAGSVMLSGMWRSASAQSTGQPTRAAVFFHGNGAHPDWAPSGSGTSFTLTPHLSGLEPVRNDIIIFRRLMAQRDMSLNPHKGATLDLSTAGGQDSIDQVFAKHVKATKPTPIPALELAIGRTNGGGGVAPSLALVGRQFLPGIRNPLFAYERIAGAMAPGNPMTTPDGGAERALMARKSLIDYLRDDVSVLRARVGGQERMRIDSYVDALRDLEGTLGGFTGDVKAGAACTKGDPPKTAMDFEAHISDMPMVNRMFMDTIAMGFACGVTRVSSMMWGGGECHEPINWLGVGQWHSTSHGNPTGAGQQTLIKLHTYFSSEFAYFIQKLKALDLFDSTVTLWGTQNGNSTETGFSKENHDRRNALFILAGRGGGYFKTLGKVVDCNEAFHNDMYLHMAKAFGMQVDTIGKAEWCKGPLPGVV